MSLLHSFLSSYFLHSDNYNIKIWVLAPYLESSDENIDYYYDFSQSIKEYERVFKTLEMPWVWQTVTMENYVEVINIISKEKNEGVFFPIVFNLCDGDETNGTPGVSVIKRLEELKLVYTGADEYFYSVTTSKIPMKKSFDELDVSTAKWMEIHSPETNPVNLFDYLDTPIIIKPAVSGGSMGVGIRNVVETNDSLVSLLYDLFKGYRGWNLTTDGLIAEKFISGQEYTVLITGSYDRPEDANIYLPVERIFHHSLPDKEKFLSFDRLWEIYETESSMPQQDNFYEYGLPSKELIEPLKKLSWDAFVSCKGKGYARVDIRKDQKTNRLYVLEINAQCGISEDENFTSIGAILKFSSKSFTSLVEEIIIDGMRRAAINTFI